MSPGAGSPVAVTVMPPVRSSVCADPDWIVPFAVHAESLGFESLALPEHAVLPTAPALPYPYSPSGRFPLPSDCAVPDPLDTLAYLASATTSLKLATGVLVLPLHHPVLLAKRTATVDRLSGGRLRLGVGLGWMPEEIEACGVNFADRGRLADESIDALRALWSATDEGASFAGEFFAFTDAHCFPKPLQAGGVPIHIGGSTRAAIMRAARRGDGWQPLGLEGDALRGGLDLLHREAAAAGRDPDGIELTLSGFGAATLTADSLEKARSDGADRVAVHCAPHDLHAALDELAALADRVGLKAPV